MRRRYGRDGGAGSGSGGCCRPVGEVALGLIGSRGGDVVRCCFVAGSATMSSATFVCWPASCVVRVFCSDIRSWLSSGVANDGW